MNHSILETGRSIKLEVVEEPFYLFFWGIISGVQEKIFTVDIEGCYIQNNTKAVKCIMPYEGKVCLFDSSMEAVSGSRLSLIIPSEKNIQILQRRKYVRVPADYKVTCFLKESGSQPINEQRAFSGTIKNISGGGVLIGSDMVLSVNSVFIFELEIEGQPIFLTARVLRNDRNNDGVTFDSGCEFIGISDADRQKIIMFCSKKQIKLRKGRT